jgi:O-antigen/teichoic acid export membrane protein
MSQAVQNVAKHTVIYGLGDALTRVVGFLLIPFYTHYLSPENYGVLDLLELTSYVAGIVLALGISEAVSRFYFEYDNRQEQEKVVSTALMATWAACLIGLPLLWLGAKAVSQLVLQTRDYFHLFQLVFVVTIINLSNEIPLTWLRIRQQSVLFTVYSFCVATSCLVLNIICLVHFKMGLEGIFYSNIIANSAGGLFLLVYMLRRMKLMFSLACFLAMLRYGVPLIGGWFGSFILHFADRFVLQRLATLSELGIYALAYKFGFLLNIILLAPFRRTWGPKQFEVAKEKDGAQTFSLVFTYYCFLQVFLTLDIAVLIKDAIFVFADAKFHTAYMYVALLLVAYNFYGAYSFLQFGILQQKKTKYLAFCTLSAGALNIAANILLVPEYGAWGAAWATVISFVYLLFVAMFFAQRLYYIPIEYRRLGKMVVAAGVLYLAAVCVNPINLLLSIIVKAAIASSYPFILALLGFYTKQEKAKVDQVIISARKAVRARTKKQKAQ